ncbi:MAG: NAD-dependent epimerase/dehydratase family protein [Clostridiales bacterium]|nr:NAD-dependent epimerase/dehydratase family protein [Clostridiales bacterium]
MLYNSKKWLSDIDMVLPVLPELKTICGHSILITGSTGLIGSAVVHLLLRYNDLNDAGICVFACGRTIDSLAERFGKLLDRDDLNPVLFDSSKPDTSGFPKVDYIIHAASPASPDLIVRNPVETMVSNFSATKALLDYTGKQGVKRLLFVSSSEVYGTKDQDQPSSETQYGYLDPLRSRNAYSIGKLASETLCISYREEYQIDSVIARPGHIYGPTATRKDIRVSSAWPFEAVSGNHIVMKSTGSSIRSYCYCLDCASALMKILLCGESACAYNISNASSIISIADLAKMITDYSGVDLISDIPCEQEKKAFNPMMNSSLNSSRLEELGWKGMFDAKTGIRHTIDILREVNPIG